MNRYFRQDTIKLLMAIIILCLVVACSETNKQSNDEKKTVQLNDGIWRASLQITETEVLPFNFMLERKDSGYTMEIMNATERIKVEDITIVGDSIHIALPYYNSAFIGQCLPTKIIGHWYNYAKDSDYKIEFYASHGDERRFQLGLGDTISNVSGRWEIIFFTDDKKSKTDAIGVFEQQGPELTGTFLTATGDYRYLQGMVNDTVMYLSCFDGAHAFLFKAQINPSGDLKGDFWSGTHWHEVWIGFRNDTISLPNPYAAVNVKDGYESLNFSFPDTEGNSLSLSDPKFDNKVVLVQVMGSWCPNCKDESALYAQIYNEYKNRGLEIVGLAFENSDKFEEAAPLLQRYQQQMNIDYPILYAGKASKKLATEKLQALSEVKSFPTTIYLDKDKKIRRIHSGFSGPATTEYPKFVDELRLYLDKLLAEING